MSASMISLILGILAILIVVLPTLFGAIRGFKKSTFRLVWVFGFGLLCYFLAGVIAQNLVNVDMSVLNLTINGEQVSNLPLYIQKLLEESNENLAIVIANNPQILELITSLASMVLSLVIFEVLFWGLKWVLYPVWLVFSIIFIKNKKTVKTQEKVLGNGVVIPGKTEKIKVNKHSLAGAGVGLIMGVIALIFTFVPIVGISNTLLTLESATQIQKEDGTISGILTDSLGEDADAIYFYRDSAVGKVLTYTGINGLSGIMANGLTSTKINGEKISLNEEVEFLGSVYVDISSLQNFNVETATQTEISNILPSISSLTDKILSSNIVKSLYNDLVPYFIDNILDNPDFFVKLPNLNNDILNEAFTDILLQVKTITADDLKNDILLFVDMASYINDVDLLATAIKNEITLEEVQSKITTELGTNLNECLFDMNSIQKILPIVIESGVKYGAEQLEIEFIEGDGELTNEQFKILFGNLFTDAVAIVKGIDLTTELYVSPASFENVGNVVDTVKQSNIISTQTYNSFIDYVLEYVNDFIKNIGLYEEIENILLNLTKSIKDVSNYKTELSYIGNAYQNYVAYTKQNPNKDVDIKTVLKMIDNISGGYIYTSNIDSILEELKAFIDVYVQDYNINVDTTNFDVILNSIKDIDNFEQEYSKIENTINYIIELIDSGDINAIISDDVKLATVGQHLDTCVANQSILLQDTNCKILIKSIIGQAELPEDIEEIKIDQKPVLEVIKQNIDGIESYQTELTAMAKIAKLNNQNSLVEVGEVLDEIKNTKVFGNIVKPVVKQYIKNNTHEIVDAEFQDIIAKVELNVEYIESFEQEMTHMQSFIDLDVENASLTEFGSTLDGLMQSKLFGNVLNDMLKLSFDKGIENISNNTDYTEMLTHMRANIDNISSENNLYTSTIYSNEIAFIDSFVNFASGEEKTLDQIKQYLQNNMLDINGNSKSIIFADNVLQDCAKLGIDKVSKDINIAELDQAFAEMKQVIETSNANILDILTKLDMLAVEVEKITNFAIDQNTTKTDIQNVGVVIDQFKATEYSVVINQTAIDIIGKYAIKNVNTKVQNSELLSNQKMAVQEIYDNTKNQSNLSYAEVFSNIGTALYN